MTEFRDFDAAWSARDRARFKAFGSEHILPAQMPVKLVLFAERVRASGRDPQSELRFDEVVEMLNPIFGADTVQGWIDQHGADAQQLTDLLMFAMRTWHGDEAGDGAGNPTSPAATSPG